MWQSLTDLRTTQTYLENPIWDRLQQGMANTVIFKDSSVILPSQEQLWKFGAGALGDWSKIKSLCVFRVIARGNEFGAIVPPRMSRSWHIRCEISVFGI